MDYSDAIQAAVRPAIALAPGPVRPFPKARDLRLGPS